MQPDEPNEEERLEELPEDNQTPFSPADPVLDDTAAEPVAEKLDDTHPSTDANIEREDVYENGLPDAAGVNEPNMPQTPDQDVDQSLDEPGGEDRAL